MNARWWDTTRCMDLKTSILKTKAIVFERENGPNDCKLCKDERRVGI